MKRTVVFFLVLLMLVPVLADNNREFRATWSITWHQYSSGLSINQLKARTIAILDRHVEANMNAVIWHVRQGGTVYYPSAIEPWGSYLGYTDPGYDPLAFAVEEAHKRGLEIHAWFNTFQTSSTTTGSPAEAHPEWVCTDGNGSPMGSSRCLSPGLKAVRDYTVSLVAEIVSNYDVDGVHFDYVRWNEYDNTEAGLAWADYAEENNMEDGNYPEAMMNYLIKREADSNIDNGGSLKINLAPTSDNHYLYDTEHPQSGGIPDSTDIYPNATSGVKFASWGDWRRASTTAFIKAAHDTVQQIKPWVKLSPAALGRYKAGLWDGYHSVFQDAGLWFNKGYIDLLTPMNYHWLTGDDMRSALTSDWGVYIGEGAAAGRPYSVGPASYLISGWAQHQNIVEECRTIDWVQGFQFFSYGNWQSSSYPQEASHTVFAKQSKQPSYHFLNDTQPAAPALNLEKNSDSLYTLTVTPDAPLTAPQWFIIYRSDDASIDPSSDEIVRVVMTDSAFTHQEEFDGLQANDGTYYYGATMSSRYWIESDVTAAVQTSQLPVLPPVVLNHTPEDAAVDVPNNQIIDMEFSKPMDRTSVENYINISPEPENVFFTWDNANWVIENNMVCHISASWEFNQAYTITVSDTVTDGIGLAIDGNGDGTAGDAYSFVFTIAGADEEAPIILSSLPADGEMSVDPDAAMFIEFNELVDHAALTEAFQIQFDGYTVYPEYVINDMADDRTVVTVKPNSMLGSNVYVTLSIAEGVTDTTGNSMAAAEITFKTDSVYYSSINMNDNFQGGENWERPGYSGSTSGIIDDLSFFSFVSSMYVPGFGTDNKAASIKVAWDTEAADAKFARVYSADHQDGPYVDTSEHVQCYVYGDNSGNQIRFALREKSSAAGNLFEVSPWVTMDWKGWKLVEWDYSEFGEWGSMTGGSLDGTQYIFDSFQFQPSDLANMKSMDIYVDQLRTVAKEAGLPAENQAPVLEAISDTSTAKNSALNIYASYSDANAADVVTLDMVPSEGDYFIRFYPSVPGKIRVRPTNDYMGVTEMMLTATDNGVGELSDTVYFYLTVSETDIVSVPQEFKVYSNYPNPFNPITTIGFDLPANSMVSMEIFNVRGQKVATPINGYCQAGHYDVPFDASALGSGIYIYKVTAGDQVSVKRMTLMK